MIHENLDPFPRGNDSHSSPAGFDANKTFVVRATAVAWNGRGIMIVGDEIGPGTLTSELVARGAALLAVGRTLLTGDGMVVPLDGHATQLPATLLIFSSYVPDSTWAPVVRQGARAGLALLERATADSGDPQATLSFAAAIASSGVVTLHGRHSDVGVPARMALECADRLSAGLPPLAAVTESSRTASAAVDLREVVGNPAWVPVTVQERKNVVRFRQLPRPFHVAHAGTNPMPWDTELRLRAVRDAAAALPEPEKVAYIYHHGYAGSTLLCRLLDSPGLCLGYDEPNVHFHHYDDPAIRALCYRTFRPSETPLIKTLPGEIRNARRHFTDHRGAHGLFVYSQPEAYVASTLRYAYRRKYVKNMARNLFGFDGDDPGDAAVQCWTWAAQEAVALAAEHPIRMLEANAFFEDAESLLARIWAWFGFGIRSDWGETLARVGATHSKSRRPFALTDRPAQQREYSERARPWLDSHRAALDAANEIQLKLARFSV